MRLQRLAAVLAAGSLASACLAATTPAPPVTVPVEPQEDILVPAPPGEDVRFHVERLPEGFDQDVVIRAPQPPGVTPRRVTVVRGAAAAAAGNADDVYFYAFAEPQPGAAPGGGGGGIAPGPRNRAGRVRLFGGAAAVPPMKMEKAAYLGVGTSPCTHVLREQLQLPRGIGLVVDVVEPESPAEMAGLKPYDVLHKLDDQLMVDARQLAVLVRMHNPGDEVKLTVIRGGKPETLTAELGEKEMRPLEEMRFGEFGGPGGMGAFAFGEGPDWQRWTVPVEPPVNPDVLVRPWRGGAAPPPMGLSFAWDDGQTTMVFTLRGGKRHLEAKDKAGKVIYEGFIDTEKDRENLPTDLREKIEKIRIETLPFPGGGASGGGGRGRAPGKRDPETRPPEKQPGGDILDLRDDPNKPAEREDGPGQL